MRTRSRRIKGDLGLGVREQGRKGSRGRIRSRKNLEQGVGVGRVGTGDGRQNGKGGKGWD
jgi:hypothetical protein